MMGQLEGMEALGLNPLDQMSDPLRIVTAAVAPVVMVSATAVLISGVNSRYISISDRVRTLTHEYRGDGIDAVRKMNIQQQVVIFQYRMKLVSWASRLLYAAVACFIAVALLICLSTLRQTLTYVTFPLFVGGVALAGVAILLQLLEIQASHKTIDLEASEVLQDIQKSSAQP
jgi:ABC-type siderophore export system fused ATPase/permease subunit